MQSMTSQCIAPSQLWWIYCRDEKRAHLRSSKSARGIWNTTPQRQRVRNNVEVVDQKVTVALTSRVWVTPSHLTFLSNSYILSVLIWGWYEIPREEITLKACNYRRGLIVLFRLEWGKHSEALSNEQERTSDDLAVCSKKRAKCLFAAYPGEVWGGVQD